MSPDINLLPDMGQVYSHMGESGAGQVLGVSLLIFGIAHLERGTF